MKRVFSFLFVMVGFFSFAQRSGDPKMGIVVETYLKKSVSADQVNTLLKILGEDAFFYYKELAYVPSINPLNPKNQKRVSSSFGNRFHPIDGRIKAHLGIDISAKAGTPVHAAASGTVEKAINASTGYGNQVTITHKYGYKTRYAHLYLFIVKPGQTLTKGDIIGFVGSTGKSTGNHIHFEVIKNGKPIDPFPFFGLDIEF